MFRVVLVRPGLSHTVVRSEAGRVVSVTVALDARRYADPAEPYRTLAVLAGRAAQLEER